jgi:ADP-ribose pyrophosphatase YjhB (NUDIX family)
MSIEPSIFEKPYKFCPTCKTELRRQEFDGQNLLNCPACNFIFWNNPKPVVSVIAHAGDKILMLQRASEPMKGYWCLPGGFINHGESPQQAATRELYEETQLQLQPTELVGAYLIDDDPRGVHIDIIYHIPLAGEITLSDEHQSHNFFTADTLPNNIAYKHRQAILDWVL